MVIDTMAEMAKSQLLQVMSDEAVNEFIAEPGRFYPRTIAERVKKGSEVAAVLAAHGISDPSPGLLQLIEETLSSLVSERGG